MDTLIKEVQIIKRSGFFDAEWYLAEYRDVAMLNQDPVEHYLKVGAKLLRNPSNKFDTAYYLNANADVAEAGMNPLLHFITHGSAEGRAPTLQPVSAVHLSVAIDVVVPVFNALEDVKLCLDALRAKKDGYAVRIIVVNDGSNEETTSWLRKHCAEFKEFHLIEHVRNQGYTTAVNTGLKFSDAPYVITLNSDTIVSRGWLRGLIRCINSDVNVGIVGPLSNAASWQNVPSLYGADGTFAVNELLAGMSVDEMAALVAAASVRAYPRTPFINGFCFMIKRSVINAIGYMDEEGFPIGYGEENDFCIRAADAGFSLAIADDTYVFHAKSKSFGHEKRKELSRKGSETLKRKHTAEKFDALVKQVKITTVLDEVRGRIAQAMNGWQKDVNEPFDITDMRVLFLLPVKGGSGGAHSVVQEVSEMRRLGIKANVAVRAVDVSNFMELYADIAGAEELFIGFSSDDLLDLAEDYDVVVATIFTSMELVRRIVDAHPSILPAYYVQDYEPLFFPEGSESWKIAFDSYALVPHATLFAKTSWIASKVENEHGIRVSKVAPSIDHGVYKPNPAKSREVLHIAAMIRPQTPRRGAERTMRVLSRIAARHKGRVKFSLFGCPEDSPHFESLQRDFTYTNLGVLKRPEVTALLGQADIFIDLSDYQAFGRTALEAMACGCTAVVPVHGGTDEYAVDGLNSLVVDSFDEDECFHRLDDLLQHPSKIKQMQLAGLQTAARYSIHTAAVSELALFATALARHRSIHPAIAKQRVCIVPALTGTASHNERHPTGSAFVRLITPYGSAPIRRQWRVRTLHTPELPEPGSAEIAVLQRDVNRAELAELKDWLSKWRMCGGKLIWELDDDLLDPETLVQRGITTDAATYVAKVRWLAEQADAVCVSTSALQQQVSRFNRNVYCVPNYLDSSLWALEAERTHSDPAYGRNVDGPVKIGYVGTGSHQDDMEIVAEVMRRLSKEYQEKIQIEVIGVFQKNPVTFGERVGLPKKHDYPNFVKWLQQRVHWDIGIIPLLDNDFNRNKSNLKFLEYAALDAAIICSDTESYRGIARHEVNCLTVANTKEAWYTAIKRLIDDRLTRERLAKNAREEVRKQYTVQGNAPVYLQMLEAVATS